MLYEYRCSEYSRKIWKSRNPILSKRNGCDNRGSERWRGGENLGVDVSHSFHFEGMNRLMCPPHVGTHIYWNRLVTHYSHHSYFLSDKPTSSCLFPSVCSYTVWYHNSSCPSFVCSFSEVALWICIGVQQSKLYVFFDGVTVKRSARVLLGGHIRIAVASSWRRLSLDWSKGTRDLVSASQSPK